MQCRGKLRNLGQSLQPVQNEKRSQLEKRHRFDVEGRLRRLGQSLQPVQFEKEKSIGEAQPVRYRG